MFLAFSCILSLLDITRRNKFGTEFKIFCIHAQISQYISRINLQFDFNMNKLCYNEVGRMYELINIPLNL